MLDRWVNRACAIAVCNRQDASWSGDGVGVVGIGEIDVVVAITTDIAVADPTSMMDVVVAGLCVDNIVQRVTINVVSATASRHVFDFNVCRDRKAAKNSTDVGDIARAVLSLRNNGFTQVNG